MIEAHISASRKLLEAGESLEFSRGHYAVLVLYGNLSTSSHDLTEGSGEYFPAGTVLNAQSPSEILCFSLKIGLRYPGHVRSDVIELAETGAVFRLDKVSFPPGAIAFRHVHAGAGTRYLVEGSLEVKSDHGTEKMSVGDAWFEDANSPVRATASEQEQTTFVRAMVLPLEYFGKPTITYLNAEDDDKPRLQTNTRYFDKVIDLSD